MLGLASAACWGAGDFSGGLAARRTHVYGVVIASQVVGILLLVGLAVAFSEEAPPLGHWGWGGLAGIAGAVGLLALYQALASGRMGVAAPISAIVAAAVPAIFGAILEGLPGALRLVGFGLALAAVWLISRSGEAAIRGRELGLPLLAGLGFGAFLILINRVSEAAVLWPLVAARLASVSLMLGVAAFTRQPGWMPIKLLPMIALAGVFDAAGNALFALAARVGRLDVAAVLSSLYPASTVWLAWLILKERISRTQTLGILAALAAIVLITV